MKSKNILLCTFLLFIGLINGLASETQHDSSKVEKRQNRNVRYNILGGPGYTPDYGLLIGGSMLMTFHVNQKNKDQPRSVIPVSFALLLANGGGISIISRPQIFLQNNRYRITGQLIYRISPDNYYGVGYTVNKSRERGSETTGYSGRALQINPIFLFKLGKSDFYIGPMIDFTIDKIVKPSPGVYLDKDYIAYGGTEQEFKTISNGVGVSLSYDTRDIPANAYSGLYLDAKVSYSPKFLGSEYNFGSLALEYRQYAAIEKFGPRRILSWTVSSKNNFGNVPPTRLQLLGSPFDLRGYYTGQYRDKTAHVMVTEYRHMFNPEPRTKFLKLWRHFGVAAWMGVGMMGPSPVKIEGVLPNAGLGLRIELQPRMNFRLDFGSGFGPNQTLVYFNMTEAF